MPPDESAKREEVMVELAALAQEMGEYQPGGGTGTAPIQMGESLGDCDMRSAPPGALDRHVYSDLVAKWCDPKSYVRVTK